MSKFRGIYPSSITSNFYEFPIIYFMLFLPSGLPSKNGVLDPPRSAWTGNSLSHLFAHTITFSKHFRNLVNSQRCGESWGKALLWSLDFSLVHWSVFPPSLFLFLSPLCSNYCTFTDLEKNSSATQLDLLEFFSLSCLAFPSSSFYKKNPKHLS